MTSIPSDSGSPPHGAVARKDSLIEYPSSFPIKVMGLRVEGFVPAMIEIARRFDPEFDASSIEQRESSGGNTWV